MSIEENKALVLRAFEAANAGDVEASIAATAPDARLNGAPFGREGDRERTRRMLAAFPDVQYDLHDLLAEGDRVAVRYTMRGTHRGELMGIPATGRKVAMPVTTIYRIANGQIAELWETYDALGLLQQIGALPTPTVAAGAASERATPPQ